MMSLKNPRIRVVKNTLRFLKPDPMLASIAPVFLFVPLKPKHIYTIPIFCLDFKICALLTAHTHAYATMAFSR